MGQMTQCTTQVLDKSLLIKIACHAIYANVGFELLRGNVPKHFFVCEKYTITIVGYGFIVENIFVVVYVFIIEIKLIIEMKLPSYVT